MVHCRRGVAVSPDRGWPKRLVNERTTPPVHIQDGSGWGQVPPLGWRDREEEYSCRRPERQTGVEEVNSVEKEACKSRKFERQLRFWTVMSNKICEIKFKWISLKSLWNKTCKIKLPLPVLVFCVIFLFCFLFCFDLWFVLLPLTFWQQFAILPS